MLQTCQCSRLSSSQTKVDGGSIDLGSSLVAGTQSTNAWYSQSKMFAFGFYQQGTGYVVAIWLESSGENTVVWTAYRDDPPVSPNAILTLTREGELVLSCEHGGVKKTIAANVSSAVMNNTGNFVLYDDKMGVIWQSFNHPTDTLLQGQSLFGGNELVSSVSKTNYSSGRFHIKMQMDGNLVMYPMNTGDGPENSYWASDTVQYDRISSNYLHLNDTGLLIINGRDSDIIKHLYAEPNYHITYRVTIGDDGILRLYLYKHNNFPPPIVWKVPDPPCNVKNFCGFNSYCTMNDEQPYCVCLPGYDFVYPDLKSRGCERNFTKAMCKSGKENITYYNMVPKERLVCDDRPYVVFSPDNKEGCSDSCLEDCNCDAAFFSNSNCEKHKFPLRYVKRVYDDSTTPMMFFKTPNVSLYNVQANASINATSLEPTQRMEKVLTTGKKTWLIILFMSVGFSIYSCISLSLTGYFVFKFRLLKYKRLLETRSLGLAEDLILQSYTYKELKKATDGFKHELGRGSFGRVYKGSFYKGNKVIAVKRLEKVVDEGEREFRAEMQPQNILMDDFWTAKISDFGLAKLLMPDQTKTFTIVRGTRGYLAPEWQKNIPISVKVDIFSYGIVLLETICCRRNLEVHVSNTEEIVLSTWVYKCFERGQLDLLVGDEQVDMAALERLVKGSRKLLLLLVQPPLDWLN
ncbi:unnamed protein product [Lactuca virosa]|uniref:Receptor-like serine/threonine-protein kinase n=1 Tax=Lactuca virosa TaxID=75947 RepID=A0AAU9PWN0_9ASTR|nr:unnamed protein product [Lactuca virosa]